MRVTLESRNRIRVNGAEPLPELRPLNDLLGLRHREGDELARYQTFLADTWGDAASVDALEQWATWGGPCDVLAATTVLLSTTGRLRYVLDDLSAIGVTPKRWHGGIADGLEQVTYREQSVAPEERTHPTLPLRAGAEIEVPSLIVLAAWALNRAAQRGDVHPRPCVSCGHWFFGRSALCDRPFRASLRTCRQRGLQDEHRKRQAAWDRARRAAYMRVSRGTSTLRSYTLWRQENTAPKFQPYPKWKQGRTTAAREARRLDDELANERRGEQDG